MHVECIPAVCSIVETCQIKNLHLIHCKCCTPELIPFTLGEPHPTFANCRYTNHCKHKYVNILEKDWGVCVFSDFFRFFEPTLVSVA